MTGAEAAARVEREVGALFAAVRDAVDDEIGPYARLRTAEGEIKDYVYLIFARGGLRREGEFGIPFVEDAETEASGIIAAVKELVPHGPGRQLIWRKRPVFELIPAQPESRKYDIQARPAGQQIYCRLVSAPVDAEFIGKWRDE